jgi:hypothetical protein
MKKQILNRKDAAVIMSILLFLTIMFTFYRQEKQIQEFTRTYIENAAYIIKY